MLRRFTDEELKERGFKQVESMNCYKNGGVIVSYGLIVAIGKKSGEGYHDYSPTTASQVTKVTGDDTATRRKKWDIMEADEWESFVTDWMKVNMRNI